MTKTRMEPSDEALVLACRDGNEAAWEALVMRYQRLIYAISRRAGLDEDLSAEVFQQVFTKLVENLHRIEQPARIHAWLVTTTRRETLSLLCRDKGLRNLTKETNGERANPLEIPDHGPLPDELLLKLEMQHEIRAAVTALDERCRKLVTLLFYRSDPLPYAEVASALGVSEGSIGPTRARCLRKLLLLLKDLKM